MADESRTFIVERHSNDYIPDSERHGTPFSLFTLWFSANMQVTTIVTGALAVITGLPLLWAIIAIVVGNVPGGIVMALHSAQGPRMGLPQMIQSRAQFGYYGAILPLVLVIILYIGFFASSGVLGGQALSAWTGLPVTSSIIIVAAICTLLAIFGYDLIHRYESIVSILFLVSFVYLSFRLLANNPLGKAFSDSTFSVGTFVLVISIIATWQITYGPCVADYSRYLREDTPISTTFWWTFGGSVISSIWIMIFGCIATVVAATAFGNDSVGFIAGQAGVSILGNFITNYSNFLLLLLYLLIPWSAINLVDFYLVRHERYNIAAIYDPDGIYGRINWRALVACIVAILVEIPFISSTFYTGPLVSYLGRADISWLIGLVVASVLYYVLMKPQVTISSQRSH